MPDWQNGVLCSSNAKLKDFSKVYHDCDIYQEALIMWQSMLFCASHSILSMNLGCLNDLFRDDLGMFQCNDKQASIALT